MRLENILSVTVEVERGCTVKGEADALIRNT